MKLSRYYKSKIFLKAVFGVVLTTILLVFAISQFILPIIDQSIETLEEKNAIDTLNNVVSMVNHKYSEIEDYKKDALEQHKQILKNTTDVVYSMIKSHYELYDKNNIKQQQKVKKHIIAVIEKLRYKNSGYFWINDFEPKMIMHPFVTKLNGKNLSDFKDPNGVYLFNEMVKTVKKNKDGGFVKYYWPKPGEDQPQPKISFVKAFKPWNWVIGTGTYIDDIDKEVAIKTSKIIDELTAAIKTIKIGKSGYMFIYDKNGRILFHPNKYMMDKNMHDLINPLTGESFYNFFTKSSQTATQKVTYKWDKPVDQGNYVYDKAAWTMYIPSLKLYVSASVYLDEIKYTSEYIMNLISKYIIIILIIMLIIGFVFLRQILNPIIELALLSKKVKNGDYSVRANIRRDDELGMLANSFNSMIKEVDQKYKQLELTSKQLIQSEKMVALGGMVAGVAHEINTPVGVALTGITHLKDETGNIKGLYEDDNMSQEEFEEFLEDVDIISKSVHVNLIKAANLIKSFKQVAVDQSSDENRVFNLKEYVYETLVSIQNQLKKTSHKVEVNIDDKIQLHSNPGAFSQIITNFVMNSIIHGFKHKENGIMTIDAKVDNDMLILKYKDNGIGLTQEAKAKIFDPFFTTNRQNGGSGLGMNIVYNIITQKLNGTIEVNSEPSKGIEFVITLPLKDK